MEDLRFKIIVYDWNFKRFIQKAELRDQPKGTIVQPTSGRYQYVLNIQIANMLNSLSMVRNAYVRLKKKGVITEKQYQEWYAPPVYDLIEHKNQLFHSLLISPGMSISVVLDQPVEISMPLEYKSVNTLTGKPVSVRIDMYTDSIEAYNRTLQFYKPLSKKHFPDVDKFADEVQQ